MLTLIPRSSNTSKHFESVFRPSHQDSGHPSVNICDLAVRLNNHQYFSSIISFSQQSRCVRNPLNWQNV